VLLTPLTALVTFGLCENVFLSHVPVEMLGEWEIVSHNVHGDPGHASLVGKKLEFHRNGSLTVTAGRLQQDTSAFVKADMLYFTFDDYGPRTISGPILHLTDTELVMEDAASGGTIKMQRPSSSGASFR
jgi:hypothetical protein